MDCIDKLTTLANKIRSKTGKANKLSLDDMAQEVNSLIYAQPYEGEVINTITEK